MEPLTLQKAQVVACRLVGIAVKGMRCVLCQAPEAAPVRYVPTP